MIHKVIRINIPRDFVIVCTYEHGEEVEYDMNYLHASTGSMAQALKDLSFFKKVFIESGAPTWPNGYDLCPEAVFREGKLLNKPRAIGS